MPYWLCEPLIYPKVKETPITTTDTIYESPSLFVGYSRTIPNFTIRRITFGYGRLISICQLSDIHNCGYTTKFLITHSMTIKSICLSRRPCWYRWIQPNLVLTHYFPLRLLNMGGLFVWIYHQSCWIMLDIPGMAITWGPKQSIDIGRCWKKSPLLLVDDCYCLYPLVTHLAKIHQLHSWFPRVSP